MRTLILLFCLLPGLASAGHLYRCVNRAGHVSYQSASCTAGQRTDRTIEFTQQPESIPASASAAATDKRVVSKSRKVVRQSSGTMRKPPPSPCARAKARRELQLQRLGFKRSFDDLSRIDAAVRAVCKGY